MAEARHHQDHFALGALVEKRVVHLVLCHQRRKGFFQFLQRATFLGAKGDAHEVMLRAFMKKHTTNPDVARYLGAGSDLKIKRGLNALWNQGGIQYAAPVR